MASSRFSKFGGLWHGEDQIVIGIDIGTTHSGVAYTYLTEGADQHLYRVTQWPGQNLMSGAKVPSVVWYNPHGNAVSFGAEALTSETQQQAAAHSWKLARHFKHYLLPPALQTKNTLQRELLSIGVSAGQVYADFLGYLLTHTQTAFESTIAGDAKAIWARQRSGVIFVLAYPGAWGPREQAFLRGAAVEAGFTTRERAQDQIRFVVEAEASAHFCLHFTDLRDCLSPGVSFVVCDAGGATVDTTLCTIEQVAPKLRLSEVNSSTCVHAGAMYVNLTAKSYLKYLFEGAGVSPEEVDEYVIEGACDFELQGKRKFDNTKETRVRVGGIQHDRENPPIRHGQLILPRLTVKSLFDPCVNEILAGASSQVSSTTVSHVILVGGFGESPYLYQRLKDRFELEGCLVTRTVEQHSKAAADGAVIWYCTDISSSISKPVARKPSKIRDEQYSVSILVMGRSGSRKTEFITHACECCDPSPSEAVDPNQGTMDPRSHRVPPSDESTLRVIDTPGLDNVDMSDLEVFTKVAAYLRSPTRIGRGITRVIYFHPASDTIRSRALQGHLRTILDLFAVKAERIRLTILVIPTHAGGVDPKGVADEMRGSNLAIFKEAIKKGASIAAATPNLDHFGDYLRTCALQPPIFPAIYHIEGDLHDPNSAVESRLENSLSDRGNPLINSMGSSYEKKLASYEKKVDELQASATRYQEKYEDIRLRYVEQRKTEASLRQQLQEDKLGALHRLLQDWLAGGQQE